MARKMIINQKNRRVASKAIQSILKPTYFADGVPLDALSDALEELGIFMVQEDNTEWEGFLCGSKGECFIRLAPKSSEDIDHPSGLAFYEPFENTGLRLTWYKCESRRDSKFEVIGYLT
ncbi:MAG: hypothetical protein DRQ78_12455 [Epsilonproteobacteria bacterium]|nr:MAG: hypothetical protein DRQ78_12455 [Campylobacterota bacterium]